MDLNNQMIEFQQMLAQSGEMVERQTSEAQEDRKSELDNIKEKFEKHVKEPLDGIGGALVGENTKDLIINSFKKGGKKVLDKLNDPESRAKIAEAIKNKDPKALADHILNKMVEARKEVDPEIENVLAKPTSESTSLYQHVKDFFGEKMDQIKNKFSETKQSLADVSDEQFRNAESLAQRSTMAARQQILSGADKSRQAITDVQDEGSKLKSTLQSGVDKARDRASQLGDDVADDGLEDLKTQAKKEAKQRLKKALKKGGEDIGEDEEAGVETGPIGELVGLGVGLTQMMTGIFANKHVHLPPAQTPNFKSSFQLGA